MDTQATYYHEHDDEDGRHISILLVERSQSLDLTLQPDGEWTASIVDCQLDED